MQEPDQKPAFSKAVAVADQQGAAPTIVAKGRGHNAEKILQIAFAEGVKVRQDSGLTDLLESFDVESPIPLEALHAVSLILERVYQEDQRLSGRKNADSPEVSP